MRTILQVPVDSKTLALAKKAALQMGFSSIQECLRVFMYQMAHHHFRFLISDKEALTKTKIKTV